MFVAVRDACSCVHPCGCACIEPVEAKRKQRCRAAKARLRRHLTWAPRRHTRWAEFYIIHQCAPGEGCLHGLACLASRATVSTKPVCGEEEERRAGKTAGGAEQEERSVGWRHRRDLVPTARRPDELDLLEPIHEVQQTNGNVSTTSARNRRIDLHRATLSHRGFYQRSLSTWWMWWMYTDV